MTDTRRVFTLEGLRLKQLLGEYDLPSDVWRPDSAPNTGYYGGGRIPGPTPVDVQTMDKTTYSTDTTAAAPSAYLIKARRNLSAVGNSTHAYFMGGVSPGGLDTSVEKTTYSTDTTAAAPTSANTSSNNQVGASATGNSTHSYLTGGGPGARISWSKIDNGKD